MAFLKVQCTGEVFVGIRTEGNKTPAVPMASGHVIEIPEGKYRLTVSTVSDLTRSASKAASSSNAYSETLVGDYSNKAAKKASGWSQGDVFSIDVTAEADDLVTIECANGFSLRFTEEPKIGMEKADEATLAELERLAYDSKMERYCSGFKMMNGLLPTAHYREYFGLPVNALMAMTFNGFGMVKILDTMKLKSLKKECKKWKKEQKAKKKAEKKANK